MKPTVGDTWYRYEDERRAHLSISENSVESYFSTLSIVLREFTVDKVTPQGAWIRGFWRQEKEDGVFHMAGPESRRFVLLNARKRFACPTKMEALQSLLARRKKQRRIYKARLSHIEEAIRQVERMIETERSTA